MRFVTPMLTLVGSIALAVSFYLDLHPTQATPVDHAATSAGTLDLDDAHALNILDAVKTDTCDLFRPDDS
ncbi:MAG: hypothetical protein ACE366_11930 [Bradymonadia bacterium]